MPSSISKRRAVLVFAYVIAGCSMKPAQGEHAETYERLHADREAFIRRFRVQGEIDSPFAQSVMSRLSAFTQTASGEPRARALYELATMQRFLQQWEPALQTYAVVTTQARALGLTDVAFDAEFGIAKSHSFGTKNHGEAAAALERAAQAAGPTPNRKQQYEIASFTTELQEAWGDVDAALVNALRAEKLAATDEERYFAEFSLGTVLQAHAHTCDYRPLVDAKSSEDVGNPYAACFRAVDRAKQYYERARATARKLGWKHLAGTMDDSLSRLEERRSLIERKAAYEASTRKVNIFNRQRRADILVNTDFSAGAESLPEAGILVPMIDHVTQDSSALDSRAFFLRGLKADVERQPEAALSYYRRSVELLSRERFSMFELRGRGTVIENRIEHVSNLGLRLLALGDFDGAFDAFESIRAHGMSALAAALAQTAPPIEQRQKVAELVQLDSKHSAALRGLVDTTIAGIEYSGTVEKLRVLDETRDQRERLLAEPSVRTLLDALKTSTPERTKLTELRKLVDATDAAVVLYWSTPTNVLVWTIAKNTSEVRTVFLPESELSNKVARLRASFRPMLPFDRVAARELFAYLVAPVRDHYRGNRLIVVPQGSLVNLPFEALVNPETDKYLVEEATVAYAPNAQIAARALRAPLVAVPPLQVVYDEGIEKKTSEVARVTARVGANVRTLKTNALTPSEGLAALGGARNLHVLLHGEFNDDDALLSFIKLNDSSTESRLRASELLGVDWSATRLVSFSSCEGATVATRISNELYGLAWAPLVSGVPRVVLSRWRVQELSNARWMATFFGALATEPMPASRASALAMRDLIASHDYAHPYYWAAPQLFGM